MLHERVKLTASDGGPLRVFGWSVATWEDTIVVGAPGANDPFGPTIQGEVYVYRMRDNGTPSDPADDHWIEEAKLVPSDGRPGDDFGASVAIQHDYVVIGATGHREKGYRAGAAYVFRRDRNGTFSNPDDDSWLQEARLIGSQTAPRDNFGYTVGISDGRVAVGGGDEAYIFRLDTNRTLGDSSDDAWVEECRLALRVSPDETAFGHAVAIDGARVAVSDPHDSVGAESAGAVYTFQCEGALPGVYPLRCSRWVYEGKLESSDPERHDSFGFSLAMRGDLLVVGDDQDDAPHENSGSAYVFVLDDCGTPRDLSDDVWFQQAKLTPSDGAAWDAFGFSVAIASRRIAVGSPGALGSAGAIYLFARNDRGTHRDPRDDTWYEEAKLVPTDAWFGDVFGASVAAWGDRIVGGSDGDDVLGNVSGSAYVLPNVVDDCNGNGLEDACDIGAGTSDDCNANWQPDECEELIFGDIDGDGDRDLRDFAGLQRCFSRAGAPPELAPCCHLFDFDSSGAVDLWDYGAFVAAVYDNE